MAGTSTLLNLEAASICACWETLDASLGLVDVVSRYLRSDSLEHLCKCHLCPQDLAIDNQSIVVKGHVLDHGLPIHLHGVDESVFILLCQGEAVGKGFGEFLNFAQLETSLFIPLGLQGNISHELVTVWRGLVNLNCDLVLGIHVLLELRLRNTKSSKRRGLPGGGFALVDSINERHFRGGKVSGCLTRKPKKTPH